MNAVESAGRIGIVDDDPICSRLLASILTRANFNVSEFSSADAFLREAGAGNWDCLLLDMEMPGLNGLQLLEMVRQSGINVPVVFVSGNVDVSVATAMLNQGAVDVIEKPVTPQEVLAKVFAAIHAPNATSRVG